MPSSLTLYPVTAHLHRLTLGVQFLFKCLVQIPLYPAPCGTLPLT